MADGLYLQTGLGGGFGTTFPGVQGTSAGASPQGPATAAQAGFGVSMAGQSSGGDGKTTGVLSVGSISLALLVFIWWSLPR